MNYYKPVIFKSSFGFTLLEILTAIALSSIVISLLFTAYTQQFKFSKVADFKNSSLREAIYVRQLMDHRMETVYKIVSVSDQSLRYINLNGKESSIDLQNKSLSIDPRKINIEKLKFTLEENSNTNKKLLLWEVTTKNKVWIGGGVVCGE